MHERKYLCLSLLKDVPGWVVFLPHQVSLHLRVEANLRYIHVYYVSFASTLYLCEGGVVDVDLEDNINMLPEHLLPSLKTFQLFDGAPELNVFAAKLLLEELFKKPSTFSALQ